MWEPFAKIIAGPLLTDMVSVVVKSICDSRISLESVVPVVIVENYVMGSSTAVSGVVTWVKRLSAWMDHLGIATNAKHEMNKRFVRLFTYPHIHGFFGRTGIDQKPGCD